MEKSNQKKPKLVFILLYIAFIICFIDRSAISIALSYIGNDFHLDATKLGIVSSAFFFSYSLMQIPGGWLADKFGSKLTVVVAILMWSLFTILTGFAWSLASLLVIRILFGIGEGAYPSASLKQISEEFSFKARSEATSAIISSNYAGAANCTGNNRTNYCQFGLASCLSFNGDLGFDFCGHLLSGVASDQTKTGSCCRDC